MHQIPTPRKPKTTSQKRRGKNTTHPLTHVQVTDSSELIISSDYSRDHSTRNEDSKFHTSIDQIEIQQLKETSFFRKRKIISLGFFFSSNGTNKHKSKTLRILQSVSPLQVDTTQKRGCVPSEVCKEQMAILQTLRQGYQKKLINFPKNH